MKQRVRLLETGRTDKETASDRRDRGAEKEAERYRDGGMHRN